MFLYLFLLAAPLVVIILQQAFLRQMRTFREKIIFLHDILAEIEGREPDDVTDLEGFLLDLPGHGYWLTGGISRDLPGLSEESAGDNLLASPANLVVVRVSVIVTTQASSTSSQSSGDLEHQSSVLVKEIDI